ncbi:MAG: glucosaminidase domain-containing protein, partial [Erysipelotrichaceae bacterium]
MRKIFSILLSLVLMSTLCISLNVIEVTEVEAAVSYAMSCSGTYELAWVNDSGGFDKVACYSTFAEAKTALATKGDDYVIRHDSSLSPTKIIAINSGIAYSYPKRSSSSTTLTITQNVDYHIYRKTTYVTQHRELANPVTTSYNGSGSGTLTIDLVGFDGFVDVKDVDLIPMKFITNGLSITIGGNTSDNSEDPFTIIPRQSYFEVVQNGNYTDVVYHYFSGWALGGYTAEYTSAIGPASDWMSVGDIYYSYDHETYYSDRNYTNYVGEYYSYYQFLPARSTTSISASTFDSYMNSLGYTSKPTSTSYTNLTSTQSQLVGEGQTFINNQNSYGVNALLVYALACLESGNGRSQYAVERNNLFGWNAVDSDPDQASYFSSISQGVMEQMAYNLRNYLDVQNAVFFGMHFGNKGSGFNVKYAADPYWGIKVAAIAYSIDKLDNNYDGTLTDYNKYDVGIVETYSESVYKNSDGTYEIHTTEYGATYQKNYTVILLESMSSGYMKTQLANMYINGSLIQSTSSGVSYPATAYDFSRDIGYIDSDSIKVITSTIIEEAPGNEAEGDFILETSEIALYDSNLEIIGLAYQPGIYLYSLDDISHQLLFVDQSDDSETSFDLTTVMLGPTNYVYGGFIGGEIDVMQFSEGIYQLYIKTTHDAYTDTSAVDIDIDLTYSYYGYDYHIYSTSSGVVLEVSERELDIEHAYNTLLSSATISDEGILSLYGVAMVEGYNNSESSIKH